MVVWQGEITIEDIQGLYRLTEHESGDFEVETVYQDRWIRVCDDTYKISVLWFVLKYYFNLNK